MTIPRHRVALAALLVALAAVFVAWFRDDPRPFAALAVFAAPPLLLAAGVLRGSRVAAFACGVLGLAWFCHGVMLAYDRPVERSYALAEVALAIVIVIAASYPGLQARFGGRPRGR